ncbi:hypothetical protein O3M35_012027 [Rhynocoris fuscipes]|uniref:Uncharacterized protein n=1 Tax=Rhynocoris fuscipes TaxID=488301 RepID=A0AAW1CS19_9HEMI
MRGELASLLKAAGRLCQETNNSLSEEEDIVCSELAGLVRRTTSVSSAGTQPIVIVAPPTQSAAAHFRWDENDSAWLQENTTAWNTSLSFGDDEYFGSVLMAALSVVLGIVILITVIDILMQLFAFDTPLQCADYIKVSTKSD